MSNTYAEFYYDGTLKWKSHDKTNANTTQASRKFRNRWPCQKLRVSAMGTGATAAAVVASLASFECSVDSISIDPKTLRAIEWHISHVLKQNQAN